MAKNDQVLSKKEQEQFKKEALKVLHDEIKGELVSEVVSEVKKELDKVVKDVEETINVEFKSELVEKVTNELEDEIKENVRKDQAKLSRRKSFKIFRLDIYILVLLAFAGFLTYKLYKAGELDFIKDKVRETINEPAKSTTTTEVTTTVKTKEMLIDEYKGLVDNIKTTNLDLLKGNVLVADISAADKLLMAYNALDEADIVKDGVIYQIDNEVLKNKYVSLFNEEYTPANFTVYGINYAYSTSKECYIAVVSEETKDIEVVKNVYDVTLENDIVKVYAYVGVLKNNYIYTVKNLYYAVANQSVGINNVFNRLSQVEYTFKVDGENYYLTSIVNIK